MDAGPLEPITCAAEYHVCLDEIAILAALDPEPDSCEGCRLLDLVEIVERYEKITYHF